MFGRTRTKESEKLLAFGTLSTTLDGIGNLPRSPSKMHTGALGSAKEISKVRASVGLLDQSARLPCTYRELAIVM
eukprot:11438300-Alexandrium_andersonii.AAC.1